MVSKKRKEADYLCMLYMFILLVVYPLGYHDYYFDITKTKLLLFVIPTLAFAMCSVCLRLIQPVEKKKLFTVTGMDKAMGIFLLANVISFLLAGDKSEAFMGLDSRYQGLFLILIYMVLYLALTRCFTPSPWYLNVFAGVSIILYLLGIFQHFGIDFLGFYEGLSQKTREKFLSTIGNINIYSEYCCITLAVFLARFSEKRLKAGQYLLFGAALFFGSMALICANSDSGIVGCAVFLVIAGIAAACRRKQLPLYLAGAAVIVIGIAAIGFLQDRFFYRAVELDSLAKIAGHPQAFLTAGIGLTVAAAAFFLLEKGPKWMLSAGAGLCMVCVVVFFLRTLFTEIPMDRFFTFNDSWGTNRGFVWSRLMMMYRDFPFFCKLFGAGQGSVLIYMEQQYADEMKVLGVVYDSAHNEYLQYLFTTGAIGLISYLAVLLTAVKRGVKDGKRNPVIAALLAGITAYGLQAFFNIGQPIVSPYLFIFLAWMEAECRQEEKI